MKKHKPKLKLYHVLNRIAVNGIEPVEYTVINEGFFVAENKAEAAKFAQVDWTVEELEDLWVRRVKLKHKGFLPEIIKRAKKVSS